MGRTTRPDGSVFFAGVRSVGRRMHHLFFRSEKPAMVTDKQPNAKAESRAGVRATDLSNYSHVASEVGAWEKSTMRDSCGRWL